MDFKMRRGGKRVHPLSIDNYATGVSEHSQQRGHLKGDGNFADSVIDIN
jgi:hypothetical protein